MENNDELQELVNYQQESNTCICCTVETNSVSKCCNVSLCRDCLVKWLEYSRQCMHCRRNLMDFEIWSEKWRKYSRTEDNEQIDFITFVTMIYRLREQHLWETIKTIL